MGDFFMIRNRLAELLSERKLKISRVANEIPNLSRNTITSTAQNSGKMIQLETVNSLCMYLGITPAEFFEYIPYDITVSVDDFKFECDTEETATNEDVIYIEKGGISFSLYIKVEPADKRPYTYEFNGKYPTNSELFLRPFEGLMDAIPFELEEPTTKFSFTTFWNHELTPGFQTVVTEQIQQAIRGKIIEKQEFLFPKNLWISISSNFLIDPSYTKIVEDLTRKDKPENTFPQPTNLNDDGLPF